MGVLKTHITACATALVLITGPAVAIPDAAKEQAQIFASCLGRYSAAREHAWLMGGEDVQAQAAFDLFQDLLDAVAYDAMSEGLTGKRLLAKRIEAKMAQAQLMQAATFQTDPHRRLNSGRMARHHLAACKTLVLG